ncbi:AraC family transcriptional regulator [Aquimarina algicola]|uniref:Helix-turn-helix transcriptional regulator n=1 Tax=Aquimarina algicola TaxID=2589995 RepID=A0A504JD02_9FLAO|nr:AraC family transcriptional regulator [Aquimarina algicola]TPN84460.1 helix-turn-helix transcriptional regulator [Aquimarina algicola]
MYEITIGSIDNVDILKQLNIHLGGQLTERWGEYELEFENSFGKGTIRSIGFDWGVSLIDYDVNFREDIKITFKLTDTNPIEFIFVSEGNLNYSNSEHDKQIILDRYQNIIISSTKNSKETYMFPKRIAIKVNFIYILKEQYFRKKNNNLSFLNKALLSAFKDSSNSTFNHFGNYNLKIADQIKQLQENNDSGIVRTLSIEGQLNLIMAMQMLEHHNHEKGSTLPESLSKSDIKKINDLSGYIIDNISEPLSIASLALKAGLTPKKLQLGFKVLYSKSVNEYIRQLKLEISRDYIKNTNDSISEIVYNIGFKSRSYFSKIFFERYGMLPTEYRKKLKTNNYPEK